jgi:lysophospholipase
LSLSKRSVDPAIGDIEIGQKGTVFKGLMEQPLKDTSNTPFSFMPTDDGHSLRYGVWYCEKEHKQGSILLLSGRREFMEKYFETIIELNAKGYDVYSLDWRGQGLSSRMLYNRHKGFIDSYDTYLKDLDAFVKYIFRLDNVLPLFILAHSMGGHIALRYLHDHPKRIEKAILVSPMIDVVTPPLPQCMVRFMVDVAMRAGFKDAYIMGSGDYDYRVQFEGNRLTSDFRRFMNEKDIIAKNPDLALGGITYSWLAATFESIDILNKSGFTEKITTPILIVSAGDDKIVSLSAQKQINDRLMNCRLIEIPGARHEILIETDAVRTIFWDAFDSFTGISSGGIDA